MKKKILVFMLSICLIIPCAFMLVGCEMGSSKPVLLTNTTYKCRSEIVYQLDASGNVTTPVSGSTEAEQLLFVKTRINGATITFTSSKVTLAILEVPTVQEAGSVTYKYKYTNDEKTAMAFYEEDKTISETTKINKIEIDKDEEGNSFAQPIEIGNISDDVTVTKDEISVKVTIGSYKYLVKFEPQVSEAA